jgi:hypothetical protein
MSEARRIASLLRNAAGWLEEARSARGRHSRFAVTHAFYAAEHVVLAVMTSEGIHVGSRGEQHQIAAWLDRLPDSNPLKSVLRRTEALTAYATTYRYPTPTGRLVPPPAEERVDAWIAAVAEALSRGGTALGVDLAEGADSPAANPNPIRDSVP